MFYSLPLFVAEAQAAAPTQAPDASGGLQQTLIMVGVALVFFYFILWRPEQKRRKEMDKKREGMKKGDRLIVAGGIVGELTKVQKDSVIIALHDGSKMEVLKVAIQDIQPTQTIEAKEEEKS